MNEINEILNFVRRISVVAHDDNNNKQQQKQ